MVPTATPPAMAPEFVPSMRLIVTGSIAFDYVMVFPGHFQDHILPEKMHILSVSFLVDSMKRLRGGTAPNIAYNLALLGERPEVVGDGGGRLRRAYRTSGWTGEGGRHRTGSRSSRGTSPRPASSTPT